MINQDQNDLNVQQDFDEFDNLVNDDFDILEEMDGADTSDNRKKRQMIFYLVLFFMLIVGGGAAWFLFFRPADTVTPLPMPGSMNQAQETTTAPPALEGLPPGVMTPEENAQANLREATRQDADMDSLPPALNEAMPPMAPSFDTTEQSMDQEHDLIGLPPAEIDIPVDGTLAEALPPPAMQEQPLLPEQAVQDDMTAQYEVMPPLPSSSDDMLPPQSPTEQSQAGQNTESEIISPAPVTAAEFAPEMRNMVADPIANSVANTTTLQLQQRLGEMENHIQNLIQELQQLRSNAEAAPAPQTSNIPESQLQELNKKLDHLAQQVDALDQRTTTFATELQQRANSPATATTEAPRQTASTPAPAAKPKAAAAKPAPRKNAVSGWELRSAQPGVAWLGRQGANEMGRYAVGQNVPGLGTVQDVTQEGGRWIVKTSGGTLRQ